MITYSVLLNAAQGGGSWTSLIFMGVLMVGLILIMIIPQKKREKQMKQMLDSIKLGQRIRTIGGIYGTVVSVKEDYVTIVSGPDDVRLTFVKGAVATIEEAEESPFEENTDTDTEQEKKDE